MDTFLDTKTIQSLEILIQWLSSTQTLSSERKRKNKESNSDFVQKKTGNYVKSYRNAVQLLFRELVEKSPVLPFQGLWLRKKKITMFVYSPSNTAFRMTIIAGHRCADGFNTFFFLGWGISQYFTQSLIARLTHDIQISIKNCLLLPVSNRTTRSK